MKEFAASVVKEFRHIFRDRRTILIAMVMPVVQIILFGFAVSTEVNDVRVVFCGDLSDAEVRRAVDRWLYVSSEITGAGWSLPDMPESGLSATDRIPIRRR